MRTPLLPMLYMLTLLASFACGSSTDDWRREAWMTPVSSNTYPGQLVPVGEPMRFEIGDYLEGPEECEGDAGCAGLSQYCGAPSTANDSAVDSVSCAGGCIVTVTPRAKGHFDVEVIGVEAGPAQLVIRLRDSKGDVEELTRAIEFVRSTSNATVDGGS